MVSHVCVSCKAPVVWTVTEKGKPMPVDAEPAEHGTVLLSHRQVGQPPVALVKTREQIEELRAQHERSPQVGPLRLFVSHFATCPNAGQHRRRGATR